MSALSANERERQLLVAWRAERLIGLGIKPPLALKLAKRADWHALARLLEIPR